MKLRLKFFLASSIELSTERDTIELLIKRKNSVLIDEGIFLDVIHWEELLQSYRGDRIQDYFNEVLSSCDVIIVLFHSKVGKFTKEEFNIAFERFRNGENPRYIFVYFKELV